MMVFGPNKTVDGASRTTRGATRSVAPTKASLPVGIVLSRLALSLMLLGVIGMTVWYWPKLTNKPVNSVAINGDLQFISKEQIQQLIEPKLDGGLLDVPLEELRRELEALPWIDSASVARVWPDGIEIAVIEQQPVARWGTEYLLNNRGTVFAPRNIESFDEWPKLSGPTKNRFEVMQHYLDLNQLLQQRNMQLIELAQDSRGAWRAELSGDVELVFGRGKLVEKMQRLFAIYDKQLYRYMNKAKRIDLRYRNGISVQWRETDALAEKIGINTQHVNGNGSAVI